MHNRFDISALGKLLRGAVVWGYVLMCAGAASQDIASVQERELPGRRLNELAVWPLGSDPVFKVFATDTAGRVTCFAADDLELLWQLRFSRDGLTAPVIGDFMHNGAPILAFGSSGGMVHFVWPGSGEVLASYQTEYSFVTAPSVARHPRGDDMILADAEGHVFGFSLNSEGVVREVFHVDAVTNDAAAVAIAGAMTQPPSTLDLDGDNWPEVLLMSETGLVQLLSYSADLTQSPERYLYRIPQHTVASTVAMMGSFRKDGDPVFGFGVGSTLHFFSWVRGAEAGRAIRPYLRTGAYGNSLGHLLLGEINSDSSPDLVSSANATIASRYLGKDLAGDETLLDINPNQLATQYPPFSAAVPIMLADGDKAVVAVDSSGMAFVWQPASQDATARRIPGVPVPTAFTPAGNLTGNNKLTMIVWNEREFTLSSVTLPVDVAPIADAAPVLTLGVNYCRNGQWGDEWQKEFQHRLTRAEVALQRAKGGVATEADSFSTTDPISVVAGLNPADPLAERLTTAARPNGDRGPIRPGGVIILVLATGATIYFIMRNRRRRG